MDEKIITGWEPERRIHFDEIVEKYNNIRPEYPDKVFEDIVQYSGQKKGKKALEIGAGTGKATAPFLSAGHDVTAVEISENMARFLLRRFEQYENFNVIISSFEDTTLENDCYDLIYAASAFHWVDTKVGCPKMFNLLTNGGACALLRYNFNTHPVEGEVLSEEFEALYEEYYYSYYKSNYRPVKLNHDLLETPGRILSGYGFDNLREYGFVDVSMKFYDVTLNYEADKYIALLDTLSDHRALPNNNRMALYTGIKKIILEQGGHHTVDCIFQLYMGRKAPISAPL